jgi:hypothetical protein
MLVEEAVLAIQEVPQQELVVSVAEVQARRVET